MLSSTHMKHGHTLKGKYSPTYISWKAMRQRCRDPKYWQYSDYGARGIAVCERWRDSFANFLADMGERPAGRTLDRIDNSRGYEPENCRWATSEEQNQNKRAYQTHRVGRQLSAVDVQEIHGRCEHGESQASVARRMGITRQAINNIRRGRTWPGSIEGYLS